GSNAGRASHYVTLKLAGTARLAALLSHLYVLIPVLDDDKHYWVGEDEVAKLMRRGEGWLESHPARELIVRRYLIHRRALARDALERLAPETAAALRAIARSDSITIDPHKLGYVPYACGAFLTPDAEHYAVSAFDAPYLDRPELGDGKWSSTLEGSRSAAGAAATWLTAETLGFGADGLGSLMAATLEARQAFEAAVREAVPEARFLPADSNIACFSLARPDEGLSRSNARTQGVFDYFQRSPHFAVSKTTLGVDNAALIADLLGGYGGYNDRPEGDAEMLVIRCVFMNPYWSDPSVRHDLLPRFIEELRQALVSPIVAQTA
ncbi:MAG: pyridoxal-dependent decarboxylase, partial [Brevundimonas sp.]|nr:pyridoxal-dependent decarboxylase [Brevundimonas sp.]